MLIKQDILDKYGLRQFKYEDWGDVKNMLIGANAEYVVLRHDGHTLDSYMQGGFIREVNSQVVASAYLRPTDHTERWHTPFDTFLGGTVAKYPKVAYPWISNAACDNNFTINALCAPQSDAHLILIKKYKFKDVGFDEPSQCLKLTRFGNGPHNKEKRRT